MRQTVKTRILALVALTLAGVTLHAQAPIFRAAGPARGDVGRGQAQTPPPAAAAANADATGEWTVTLYTPQEAIFRGAIAQAAGGKLKGYMSDEGAEYPLTGTVEGTQVKFTWTVIEAGQDIPITLTGKIERNEIAGTATIGEYAKVEFAAQRTSTAK
jgi:hypothetical protein